MKKLRFKLTGGRRLFEAPTLPMCAAFALATVSGWSPHRVDAVAPDPERIAINDNRVAGGTLAGGVLTIRLEARAGEWRPDGDDAPGVVVKAFAVEDGPLQVPGPLVRVPEGTEIHAFVHNSLKGDALAVHGMYSRPGKAADASAAVLVPAGEIREVRFVAGSPGTYYYWAATAADTPLAQRPGPESQLSGAFVVDPRDRPSLPDRVLLIGLWGNAAQVQGQVLPAVSRIVINGRSWPHTERLAYQVGDSVRLRVINAGAAVHPMHLHGFYFNVESRGDEREDANFAGASAHMAVTERLAPGRTFALTWKPTRPGNWLFHCHDNAHLERRGTLDGSPGRPSGANHHAENHALEMMAGPVMGITVSGVSAEPAGSTTDTRRHLRLVARLDTGGTDDEPAFGFTLETGDTTTAPAPPYLPGPTILLKRGEPVSISVANQLSEPTAVHWHGIELESYYDGVAGFAGEGKRIAPAIQPGGVFEARFTPPRSGTFIYHTHIDETRQQKAGLSGPLLVVDSPESFDPEHDIVLMVTVPRKTADANVVLLNGSSTPSAREMRAGQHYRLRFINLHISRPSMRMRVLNGSALLAWRAVAKDGMDLPADQAVEAPSEVQMGNGETYDFDFVPTVPGEIRIDVTNAGGVLLVSMPVHVR
jgi:FtsP/CotA-like multicopper oxidase with cupredoxin domain